MNFSILPFDLRLRDPFTTARASHTVIPVLLLALEHDGIIGWGESCPSRFHGQTPESVRRDLEGILPWLGTRDPREYRLILREAAACLKNPAALCALDLALHDWNGKRHGLPLFRVLGVRGEGLPPTSITIGLDAIPKMLQKLRSVAGWPIVKIKLGTERDVEIVRALREESPARFIVDANCGWTPAETIDKSALLRDLGVELIEQPLPPREIDAMERVFERSALPIYADESCVHPSDVAGLAGRFHGINIKLVKCGGIEPALRMIGEARDRGMGIMLGCMLESSNACAAAAHLGSLADWLDLDGPALIENDPFDGLLLDKGNLRLSANPGLGVVFRSGAAP